MAVKSIKQSFSPNQDLKVIMEAFRQMVNHCIRIGLENNASTLKKLSLLAYHTLDEYQIVKIQTDCNSTILRRNKLNFYAKLQNLSLMMSKKTYVGIGVGIVILAIGIFALITSLGIQKILVDEKLEVGDEFSYQFDAPEHSREILNITGDAFHVKLQTPGLGLQIDDDFKKEVSFEWFILEDGQNRIEIQNTGNSEIHIEGTFERSSDPLLLTLGLVIITAGVVIIGLSVGFSARKHCDF